MERIRRWNQLLLLVLGIFALGAVIANYLVAPIQRTFERRRWQRAEEERIRRQLPAEAIITVENDTIWVTQGLYPGKPKLLDPERDIYLVEIEQRDYRIARRAGRTAVALSIVDPGRWSPTRGNNASNILITRPLTGSRRLVFAGRVGVVEYRCQSGLIAYDIVERDDNGNGRLDPGDRHSLYISDVTGEDLRLVASDLEARPQMRFEKDGEHLLFERSWHAGTDSSVVHHLLHDVTTGRTVEIASTDLVDSLLVQPALLR
jgi:hypothetical protein